MVNLDRMPGVRSISTRLDRNGELFFQSGRSLAEFLVRLGHALEQRRFDELEDFYSHAFIGQGFRVNELAPLSDRDEIRVCLMRPSSAQMNSCVAREEWRTYLEGFDRIEQISLHLHRLHRWKKCDYLSATVRFELMGERCAEGTSVVDRADFIMEWARLGETVRLQRQTLIRGERILSHSRQFQSVGNFAGIDFRNQYYPPFLGEPLRFGMIRYGPGGITVADYDNDGFYDLFIPDGVYSRLFRNRRDGTFEDVTEQAGLSGLDGVSVATFADYDNDGFKDLFISRTFQPNQLFRNNGDGTFRDVTKESGIGEDCCTTVAGWADYDNDGFLDLYVGRYLDPRKDIPTTFYARNGEANQLYHNNGDGTFTNVTEKAGVGETGLCLGVVWGDFNDDGRPDLYVVNDFGRKTLYRNDGDGTFRDITAESGTLAYGAGMSASYVDYDNDGRFDYYVTHIQSDHSWFAESPTVLRYMLKCVTQGTWKTDMPLYWEIFRQSGRDFVRVFQQMASGNTLLRNKGDGTFEDVTQNSNANPRGWFWGASFGDFDNDGWQDVYMANGWVYNDQNTEIELEFLNNVVTNQNVYKTGLYFDPKHFGRSSWHGWERNRYLRNNRDGTFREIGHATGTDLLLNSRGVAIADFWNRGLLDIAVSASTDRHALLKNCISTGRNWLQVELVGRRTNRDAVGARVTVHAGGKPQFREVVLGDGYGSQNSLRQHFGLDHCDIVETLIVRWPVSGIVQTFKSVPVNQIVEVTEGEERLVTKSYPPVLDGAHAEILV